MVLCHWKVYFEYKIMLMIYETYETNNNIIAIILFCICIAL